MLGTRAERWVFFEGDLEEAEDEEEVGEEEEEAAGEEEEEEEGARCQQGLTQAPGVISCWLAVIVLTVKKVPVIYNILKDSHKKFISESERMMITSESCPSIPEDIANHILVPETSKDSDTPYFITKRLPSAIVSNAGWYEDLIFLNLLHASKISFEVKGFAFSSQNLDHIISPWPRVLSEKEHVGFNPRFYIVMEPVPLAKDDYFNNFLKNRNRDMPRNRNSECRYVFSFMHLHNPYNNTGHVLLVYPCDDDLMYCNTWYNDCIVLDAESAKSIEGGGEGAGFGSRRGEIGGNWIIYDLTHVYTNLGDDEKICDGASCTATATESTADAAILSGRSPGAAAAAAALLLGPEEARASRVVLDKDQRTQAAARARAVLERRSSEVPGGARARLKKSRKPKTKKSRKPKRKPKRKTKANKKRKRTRTRRC